MSKCRYFKVKSKKYEKYLYCSNYKCKINFNDCNNCKSKEYKQQKNIRNKSKKLAKSERNRKSILQNDTERCFVCSRKVHLDKDEAFGGSNRQTSIKWNLIYYLCRMCHGKKDIDKELRQKLHNHAKEVFIEKYGEELFLKEFGKFYIEK